MIDFSSYEPAEIANKFINTTNVSLFLTGKAGTGKTTFLKNIVRNTHKNVVVAAPTGIAAINAGGVTLHSLFQLPFGSFIPNNNAQNYSQYVRFNTPKTLLAELKLNASKRKLIRQMELLIIDEVSMLRSDLLDAIDHVMKYVRRNKQPFGGCQLLFIGDLLQLPPVVKEVEWNELQHYYESPFFFSSAVLKQGELVKVELNKVYRQTNDDFIQLLNHLRDDCMTKEDINLLNTHYDPSLDPLQLENCIFLTTHNRKADSVNNQALKRIEATVATYGAEITGEFYENSYPIEATMTLKVGAQVMFIKNDVSGKQRYFNGKIGKVSRLTETAVYVRFADNDEEIEVEKYSWENKRYGLNTQTNEIEEKVLGTFTHFPIKLAWAITIHKSQGLTFEKAAIDVTGSFAPGQVYVALSRLTSLEGLILSAPFEFSKHSQNHALLNFNNYRTNPTSLQSTYTKSTLTFLKHEIIKAFNFEFSIKELQEHVLSYNKEEKRSEKQKYKEWADNLLNDYAQHLTTSGKFLRQVDSLLSSTSLPELLPRLKERVEAAITYFQPFFIALHESVVQHATKVSVEKSIKTYLKELSEVELVFLRQVQLMQKVGVMVNAVITNNTITKEQLTKLSIQASVPLSSKKVDSKAVSYNLYKKEGKSIVEIARLRDMAPSTIEGHLAYYVAQGEMNATDIIPEDKFLQIKSVFQELKDAKLTPIKERLGNKFSYSEIKLAIAELTRV